ncbi:hypothetical protein BD414DRAFT_494388 [Trametes punicea]|nr:hypothetical protein BD414DRAFT_494388 [Trametes punicea]
MLSESRVPSAFLTSFLFKRGLEKTPPNTILSPRLATAPGQCSPAMHERGSACPDKTPPLEPATAVNITVLQRQRRAPHTVAPSDAHLDSPGFQQLARESRHRPATGNWNPTNLPTATRARPTDPDPQASARTRRPLAHLPTRHRLIPPAPVRTSYRTYSTDAARANCVQ